MKVWLHKWVLLLLAAQMASALVSQTTEAGPRFSKALAHELMLRRFGERFTRGEIQSLVITEVTHSHADLTFKVSYRVTIQDRRDPDHPALNHMNGTVLFALQDGRWGLQRIIGLKQFLEFQDPE